MKSLVDIFIQQGLNESVLIDETIDSFVLLCKYADFFNTIEKNWHEFNKSTPNSRAIKEETDRLFDISEKAITMIYLIPKYEYDYTLSDEVFQIFDESHMMGKKLSTIIRRTDEWKIFFKTFKKFNNGDFLNGYSNDGQIKNLMKQFIIISKDFVDDVQT